MKKLVIVSAALSFLFLLMSPMALIALAAPEESKAAVETMKPVDVGNKICPVLGEKIDEKTKATYEYEGKIYNFCCAMCVDTFKKEPEKYIKKIKEQAQDESKAEVKYDMKAMEGQGSTHQDHIMH